MDAKICKLQRSKQGICVLVFRVRLTKVRLTKESFRAHKSAEVNGKRAERLMGSSKRDVAVPRSSK